MWDINKNKKITLDYRCGLTEWSCRISSLEYIPITGITEQKQIEDIKQTENTDIYKISCANTRNKMVT